MYRATTFLKLSFEEERKLILELSDKPPHFKMNPNGIELGCRWADLTCASVLLSRTAYWGETTRERLQGLTRDFPPAKLNGVMPHVAPRTNEVFVVYLIGGDPEHLRYLRWLFSKAMLVAHEGDRRLQLDRLAGIYLETKRKVKVTYGNEQEFRRVPYGRLVGKT